MPDLLQRGSDWLEDQRTQHATRWVTYQRGVVGDGPSVQVQATIGRTTFDVDNGTDALLRVESRDYLILTVDLVLEGEQTPPKQGDTIRESMGQTVMVYEVMAPGGAPHFRFSDPYRKTLRIHTKFVSQEPL